MKILKYKKFDDIVLNMLPKIGFTGIYFDILALHKLNGITHYENEIASRVLSCPRTYLFGVKYFINALSL